MGKYLPVVCAKKTKANKYFPIQTELYGFWYNFFSVFNAVFVFRSVA